jgi:hypothetical protein
MDPVVRTGGFFVGLLLTLRFFSAQAELAAVSGAALSAAGAAAPPRGARAEEAPARPPPQPPAPPPPPWSPLARAAQLNSTPGVRGAGLPGQLLEAPGSLAGAWGPASTTTVGEDTADAPPAVPMAPDHFAATLPRCWWERQAAVGQSVVTYDCRVSGGQEIGAWAAVCLIGGV